MKERQRGSVWSRKKTEVGGVVIALSNTYLSKHIPQRFAECRTLYRSTES